LPEDGNESFHRLSKQNKDNTLSELTVYAQHKQVKTTKMGQ